MSEKELAASSVAILGVGNLGRALAVGWTARGPHRPERVRLTRRRSEKLSDLAELGHPVGTDNVEAVERSDLVVIAVQPQQIDGLLDEISEALDPKRHRVISLVSGVSIARIRQRVGPTIPVVRAMPNMAVSIGESMTCIAADEHGQAALLEAQGLFDLVGRTLVISEEMVVPATALCACGVAFFLRAVRAASQGGIEIGFHPEEAVLLAAQTARGAASLLLGDERHPESEIDRVTTPRGCTIAGLNEMEHQGFSSALIKGILLSADKAERLYQSDS
jgi:pyrroline-5-carboxylate reductase